MLPMLVRLYLTVAGLLLCSLLLVQQAFPHLFPEPYAQSARQDFAGELRLLRDRLDGADGVELRQRLLALNRDLPERYRLLAPAEVEALSVSVRAQLAADGSAGDHLGSDQHRVYLRLGDGQVVQIGYVEDDYPARYLAYVTVLALMLLALLLWLQPLWGDLERLREVAERFGDGDLEARAPLRGGSSIRQLCVYFNNMADQIGRLIQSQRDLVNAASHELRTPITRLEFGLANLSDSLDDRVARARVHALRCDVEELDLLVGELLTLGMLERNGARALLEQVEAGAFLRASAGLAAEELRTRGTAIDWLLSPALAEIVVEPRSFARAFSNLMRNALRYADGLIRVVLEPDDGGGWRLIVEDDGVGIPVEDRDRVFEPFYRLDRSRDRATGGFGLGLSIVRQVIDRHGGEIRVEASQLRGARFVIRLPAHRPGELRAAAAPDRDGAGEALNHAYHLQ